MPSAYHVCTMRQRGVSKLLNPICLNCQLVPAHDLATLHCRSASSELAKVPRTRSAELACLPCFFLSCWNLLLAAQSLCRFELCASTALSTRIGQRRS